MFLACWKQGHAEEDLVRGRLKQSILITGGAGFIGSRLAAGLKNRGFQVRILDSLSPQVHGLAGDSPTRRVAAKHADEFIIADVRDREALTAAVEGMDAVVHLAAETGTGQSMYEIERYADVNVMGTAKLLDVLGSSGSVKRLVVASSRSIYGEGKYLCSEHGAVYPESRLESDMQAGYFDPRCPECHQNLQLAATHEGAKIHPASVYGVTKQVQEQLVLLFGSTSGIPAIALRYQNVYGPGQSLSNPYTGILSIFSTRFKAGGDINIFEDGKESRDFVYIDDVVLATIAAVEAPPEVTGSFNVGLGEPVDVLTVATLLKEKLNANGQIRVTGNFRVGDIRHNFADISRAEEFLGWKPEVKFEEGLNRFVAWVKSERAENDSYEHALEELRSRGMLK
jgi:dTDP-L-rhamnose 4-epimerase